jgi:anaerobic selenocysteine-containing dehydrogenase
VPFAFPPNSLQLIEWFPLGMDCGHMSVDVMLEPEKYHLDFRPEVLLTYHSNPVWNMPGTERVKEAMARFDYVISIDVLVTETTEWADLVLPDHTYLESTVLVMCEPPVVKGLALRQPVIPPLYDTRDATEILIDIADRCGFLNVWNDFLNFLLGLTARPELMLQPDTKYTAEEIADRVCRTVYGDDHDLAWFKEHGHKVVKRAPEEMYMPYAGLRIPFYYEVVKTMGEDLRARFEEVGYEWDTSSYVPLPSWSPGPVHRDDPEYDLYAITFKSAETNFAENLSIPVIANLTRRVAHHRGVLLNPATARARAIEDGDRIEIASRFGRIEGTARLVEGIHPDAVAVSNAITRDIGGRRGTHFNALLPIDLEYTDTFTGALEACARVRVSRLAAADGSRNGRP